MTPLTLPSCISETKRGPCELYSAGRMAPLIEVLVLEFILDWILKTSEYTWSAKLVLCKEKGSILSCSPVQMNRQLAGAFSSLFCISYGSIASIWLFKNWNVTVLCFSSVMLVILCSRTRFRITIAVMYREDWNCNYWCLHRHLCDDELVVQRRRNSNVPYKQ